MYRVPMYTSGLMMYSNPLFDRANVDEFSTLLFCCNGVV